MFRFTSLFKDLSKESLRWCHALICWKEILLCVSSNTVLTKCLQKPVQCKLLLHVTLHWPADPSLLCERSWAVTYIPDFLEGLAEEENMNGLSPIIWSFVAPDDSCWFNIDCLVLEKEITGLTESWMQLDCESMLSRSGFAEEEGCTPTIMTEIKVFGMLQFSNPTYSSSRNWFLDSFSQMTKAPAHAEQKFSSFNELCMSLEFWEKRRVHQNTHRLLSVWGTEHMMITVCALKRKAISLILVFLPAACVTRAGFSLNAVKILMHRKYRLCRYCHWSWFSIAWQLIQVVYTQQESVRLHTNSRNEWVILI